MYVFDQPVGKLFVQKIWSTHMHSYFFFERVEVQATLTST